MQDTYGYQTDFITLYSQTISVAGTNYISNSELDYDDEVVPHTLSNPILNKVTDLTLNSYNLGAAGVTHIILEVDQVYFQDIGREHHIACGAHDCSKFNKPIQYFLLRPSSTLTQYETLTFPSIVTPDRAGDYQFRLRIYKNKVYVKHSSFDVTILPEQMAAPLYRFDPTLETETVLYPNTDHYFSIDFTTVNPMPKETSFILITINNFFTLSSDFCIVTTAVDANDTRGIQC